MDSNNDDELLDFTFIRRPCNKLNYVNRPSTSSSTASSSPCSSPSPSSTPSSPSKLKPYNYLISSLKMFLTNNYQSIANHGTQLAEAGSFERAIEYLSLAISLDSSDFRLYYNRALCYLEVNKPDKALKDVVVTIKSNPLWSRGYFLLGQSLARFKQFRQAESAYKKSLNLEKDNEETRAELIGNIYDALIHYGYDEIKAGFASSKYFSIEEAREALEAGAFEVNLSMTRSIKKKHWKKKQNKKGILVPSNFF